MMRWQWHWNDHIILTSDLVNEGLAHRGTRNQAQHRISLKKSTERKTRRVFSSRLPPLALQPLHPPLSYSLPPPFGYFAFVRCSKMHRIQEHESSMCALALMTKPFGVWLLGFLLIFKLCGRSTASDPNLLKRVSGGLVQGVWEGVKQHSSDTLHVDSKVAVWKSIPYGQAPVGTLRWRAPLPAAQWSGTLDGSVYRPPCIQPDGSGSEDCLHVHVTAPSDALNATLGLLPVLVYIHGGGLMDGSGIYEYMSAFAMHANVVVVAINYRLNVFGWLALDSLRDPDGSVGNYGMRDQQLALSWVRSNLRVFGGDPGRLTVAGQSSGGTSIFALLCSPFSVGLFDAAISLSGSINISMSTAQAFSQNEVIADLLQCSGVSTSECLRNTSVQQLVLAQQNSSWGRTPGIFGLDKTSPRGLSPSKDWFGTSLNTLTAALQVMRLRRYPRCRRGEHRTKLL